MKTKLAVISLGAGAIALAMAGFHASWGQSGEAVPAQDLLPAQFPVLAQPRQAAIFPDVGTGTSIRVQLDAAMKKLRNAETDEAKDEAKKETQTLLDSYFEADMKKREQEIADVELRVKRLRAQLEKRQAAKDEIIQLQLKLIEHEAEGLGFFSRPASSAIPSPSRTFRTAVPADPVPIFEPRPASDPPGGY